MLNKQQAKKLVPLVNHPQAWEALKDHLQDQKDLILQGLVVATSEQELFLNRGKWALVEHLDKLRDEVKVTLEAKGE
jgi:hypothetical protein